MRKEDYRDGLPVAIRGLHKGIANELELCGDGSYVVHVFFPNSGVQGVQWRVPVGDVEPLVPVPVPEPLVIPDVEIEL